MPHLNGLAEESFVFDNCYVTQAVCSPSRASIMSGLYPLDAGMPVNLRVLPTEVRTIAEMLPGAYHIRLRRQVASGQRDHLAARFRRVDCLLRPLVETVKYRKFKAPFQVILAPRQRP